MPRLASAARRALSAFLLALFLPSVAAGQAGTSGSDALSSLAPPAAFADPGRVEALARALPAIDSIVAAFVRDQRVPGAAYGIVVDGRLFHVSALGVRDVGSGAAADTSSVFRIASMSKSFTALAILKLRDEGRLSLDDPAERWIPELAGLRYPTSDAPRITIRHLLTHAGGFPEDNPWGDQQLAATDEAMGAMMRSGIPFSTAPGTAYEYSNYGFAILGRIAAAVSGRPFARYLEDEILRPLGMVSTTLEVATVPASRLARGYRLQDGAWLDEPALADGSFGAMGGVLTSAADLSRWVALMLDAFPARDGEETGPVRRSSIREMQQMARPAGATVVMGAASGTTTLNALGYGFGLRVQQTCEYRHIVSHTGGLPGYGSIMRWLPEYGVGVIAMGNLTYTPWTPVSDRILGALAQTGGLVPRVPSPSPVLLHRQEQVTRLVQQWSDPLADSLAAMNLFRDEPAPRRRAAIEAAVQAAGGECRSAGAIVAENALRGRWRMACAAGDLLVSITLAPVEPATVQFLSVTPLERGAPMAPVPAPACRAG